MDALSYGRKYPDIFSVPEISENDQPCLDEIRKVLQRHNKLDRFGVVLLHSHFPLAEDETLLETCDLQNRSMTLRAIRKSDLADIDAIETSWSLDSGQTLQQCRTRCRRDHDGPGEHVPCAPAPFPRKE